MKKLFLLIALVIGSWNISQALDASVSYATFQSADQSYVEISVFVVGSTVNFQRLDSMHMQAAVEVIILFKQGEEIIKFDKFRLNSPIADQPIDFMDMKRYGLPLGSYDLEVSINDLTMENNAKTFSATLEMHYDGQALLQSDLQLLSTVEASEQTENPFFKNGYLLKPLPFNFYGRAANKLAFYNEIYNSDKTIGEDFMISYSIEAVEANGEGKTVVIGHKRRHASPIDVLLLQMDISELPSGNYQLVVDVRNRQNELLSSRTVPFQRSNPFLDMTDETLATVTIEEEFVGKLTEEEILYSLKAIIPVVDGNEAEFLDLLIKNGKLQNQRIYLFNYWARRDPNQPEQMYDQYMEVARAVDQMYNTGFGYGFQSDRGYVYLKYGRPDDIVTEWNDPSAPPYEIWSYNYVPSTRQSNARFIFYNPTLAGDDFRLLHSTVRGELQNPQWEVELYRNAPNEIDGNDYFQGTRMQENFGRQARQRVEDW